MGFSKLFTSFSKSMVINNGIINDDDGVFVAKVLWQVDMGCQLL